MRPNSENETLNVLQNKTKKQKTTTKAGGLVMKRATAENKLEKRKGLRVPSNSIDNKKNEIKTKELKRLP